MACVTKYVIRGNTVCTRHLMNSLLHRTENARTKQRILDESLQFLKMITLFPEAMRLFLLGLRHEMTVCSQYSLGGYHDRRRRCEGAYSVDYLENCEGASISVVRDTVRSLETLCRYLQDIFSECVDSLKWRLGVGDLVVPSNGGLSQTPLLPLPPEPRLDLRGEHVETEQVVRDDEWIFA